MNDMLKKRVQERYVAMLTERDDFVSKANQKLGEYAGRLAELEEMLKQIAGTEALETSDRPLIVDDLPNPIQAMP